MMRSLRWLALLAIAGLISAGVFLDSRDRPTATEMLRDSSALSTVSGRADTWFCPGASGAGGPADLTIEMANQASQSRTASVSVLSGGAGAVSDESGPPLIEVEIEPQGRAVIEPSGHAPGAQWVGAVVEVDGEGVVVDQIVATRRGGVGRSACLTKTSDLWVVSNGATRQAVEGERFVVMLLNPYPDFAVADVELIADVGRDSVQGLVIPARGVIGFDVTEELTVASTVSAAVNVVSGRLAASWFQIADGPSAGSGAWTASASPDGAASWYLPVAHVRAGRRDVVAVTNPSLERTAEVDLSFIASEPTVSVIPIELTVRPERTALVDLSAQPRLEGIGPFTVVVRSVGADPVDVTASITTLVDPVLSGEAVEGSQGNDAAAAVGDAAALVSGGSALMGADAAALVSGGSALMGADAAARRWMASVEATAAEAGAQAVEDAAARDVSDRSSLVIVNPSQIAIALVDVIVGGDTVRSLELGPQRRVRLPVEWLGEEAFVVEVAASAPVIVARELVGLTSRSASLAVAVDEPVKLNRLR